MRRYTNMNDKELFESYKKRFQQICEFTVPSSTIDEDGEQPMEDPNAMGGDPNAMPPQGDPNAMGGAPQGPEGFAPQGDPNQMPPQGDPNAMGGAPQGPEEFAPQGDPNQMPPQGDPNAMGGVPNAMPPQGDPNSMGGNEGQMQPDDEVIDVSQITDEQKKTNDEIKGFDEKFSKLYKYLDSVENLIKTNDEKIESLKKEFEKRNPTQEEKLGLQTTHSGPYNLTVDDFWKKKEATSNYRTEPDDLQKKQYTITSNDVNGSEDWKNIADSMTDDEDDIIYNQNLKNIMGV